MSETSTIRTTNGDNQRRIREDRTKHDGQGEGRKIRTKDGSDGSDRGDEAAEDEGRRMEDGRGSMEDREGGFGIGGRRIEVGGQRTK